VRLRVCAVYFLNLLLNLIFNLLFTKSGSRTSGAGLAFFA
jgi:hypothetical protein